MASNSLLTPEFFGADGLTLLANELDRLFGNRYSSFSAIRVRPDWSVSARMQDRGGGLVFTSLRPAPRYLDPTTLSLVTSDVLVGYHALEFVSIRGRQYLLTVRPFRPRMLADSPIYAPRGYGRYKALSRPQGEHRARVVRDVVKGLMQLHSSGVTHNDLRPANISVGADGGALVDMGLESPAATLSVDEAGFVAPELRDGGHGSTFGDVYAAGELMRRLLLDHFSPDESIPIFRQRASSLYWLADRTLDSSPEDRPAATDIWAVMFGQRAEMAGRVSIYLSAAAREFESHLARVGVGHEGAVELSSRALAQVELHLMSEPLTLLGVNTPERARAVLALTPVEEMQELDKNLRIPHNLDQNDSKSHSAIVKAEYLAAPEDGIDREWKRRILSDYVEVVGELEDDATLEVAAATMAPEHQELYKYEIEFASRVRSRLLASDGYFTARSLARLMTRELVVVEVGDIDTHRVWGNLFAVRDHGAWIYPHFQFDRATGSQHDAVRLVQQRVPDGENPWTVLSWWMTPNSTLNGLEPRELLGQPESESLLVEAIETATR